MALPIEDHLRAERRVPRHLDRHVPGRTLEQVREIAAETEQIMHEENSDWFVVMRFHDMELIT